MSERRSTSSDDSGASTKERRGPRVAWSGAWFLLVLLSLLDMPSPEGPAADQSAPGADDLITGRSYYLTLDVVHRSATLMLQGATLDTYQALEIETGHPRRFFHERPGADTWPLRVWTGGRLDPARRPARIEVIAPEEGAEEDSTSLLPIPPTAEESIPVPETFRIRYSGGLTVVVRATAPPDSSVTRVEHSLARRAMDRAGAAADAALGRDTIRLRLTLSEEDACRLYRTLPDGTALLVLGTP